MPSNSAQLISFFPLSPGNSSKLILFLVLHFFLMEGEDQGLEIENPKLVLFWINVCPSAGARGEVWSFPVLKNLYPQTLKITANRIAATEAAPMIIQ